MYSVSNDYISKMFDQVQTHRLSGTIGSTSFSDSDVIGVSYTNRCSDKKVNVGSVNIGTLKLTFLTDILNRGEYYGKAITLSDSLLTGYDENDDPVWESVPLGTFYVGEAKWTSAGMVNVTAYDCLSKLDTPLNISQTTGKVYDFCTYIATATHTTFGMTSEECEALPNGDQVMSPYEETNMTTWRDLLSAVAQMVGGFAYAGRDGKWYLKTFSDTSVVTIPKNRRIQGTTFSDYTTYYDTIQYTDVQTKEVRVIGDGMGLTMNLGNQPFLQYGLPNVVTARCDSIVAAIKKMRYVPFSVSGLPALIALDLGDVITLQNDYSGNNSKGAVMYLSWTYNKSVKFECYGENPNLRTAQSATDKDIAGLMNKTSENEVVYYQFANLQQIEIEPEEETLIASLNFTALQNTTVKILHELIMDMVADLGADCSYELKYYLNDELVSYAPYERIGGIQGVSSGDTTETSICRDYYYILQGIEAGVRHNWKVCIVTHGIDSTTIDVNHAHVTLEGQRLLGSNAFSGLIEISDTMPMPLISGDNVTTYTETINVSMHTNVGEAATDTIDDLLVGGKYEDDPILDQTGEAILDQNGDEIIAQQRTIVASVDYPDFSEECRLALLTLLMEQGKISDNTGTLVANFDTPIDITDYDYVLIKMSIGDDVFEGATNAYGNFYIVTPSNTYELELQSNYITCVSYSGAYVNIYVDVYGAN